MMYFDTCAHPTVDGRWINDRLGETFDQHYSKCIHFGVTSACAVGLPSVGGYDHKKFYDLAQKYDGFYYPVAAITKTDLKEIILELKYIKSLGYSAVKLHPRLLNLDININWLAQFFHLCNKEKLVVFYCTYSHCSICNYVGIDHFNLLINALKGNENLKVVLLHGGATELLRYSELVRFNPNLLLDLSLTLMKYSGSSVDADLNYLFRQFDQRISIGTDHPEWELEDVFAKVNNIAQGVSEKKKRNIFYENAYKFLNITKTRVEL